MHLDGSTCPSFSSEANDTYIFNYRGHTATRVWYTPSAWERLLQVDYANVDDVTQLALVSDHIAQITKSK